MVAVMKRVVNFIVTPNSIVVIWDEDIPTTIPSTNASFVEIRALLLSDNLDEVPDKVDKALKIKVSSKGKFHVSHGIIQIDGETLPGALSDKLIELIDANEDTQRLENFWDNLAQNPTPTSRVDLYNFLSANNVPITEDGCIIVYRKVKSNFWDCHTGKTFLSEPGTIIEMDREDVDSSRATCSAGLHVAAYEYAQGFSSGHLMECKVNPRDVVAVPPDYSQQKMRVCRAEILRIATGKFTESAYNEDVSDNKLVEVIATAVVEADSEGRLRIPGSLIRKLGIGVGYVVEVVYQNAGDTHLTLRAESKDQSGEKWAVHNVRDDNSVRISPTTLGWAGIDSPVSCRLVNGELILGKEKEATPVPAPVAAPIPYDDYDDYCEDCGEYECVCW